MRKYNPAMRIIHRAGHAFARRYLRGSEMHKLKLALIILSTGAITVPSIADDHSVIATDDIEWGLLNPLRGDASPRAADLWGDRTKDIATGMLVKFKKGFSSTQFD